MAKYHFRSDLHERRQHRPICVIFGIRLTKRDLSAKRSVMGDKKKMHQDAREFLEAMQGGASR